MNTREQRFFAVARKHGYRVLRNGWPDFLLVRRGHKFCVEVIKAQGFPKPHQRQMFETLRRLGVPVLLSIDGTWPPVKKLVRRQPRVPSWTARRKRPRRNPWAVKLGRQGGQARAQRLPPERRSEIARFAARARWHPEPEPQTQAS